MRSLHATQMATVKSLAVATRTRMDCHGTSSDPVVSTSNRADQSRQDDTTAAGQPSEEHAYTFAVQSPQTLRSGAWVLHSRAGRSHAFHYARRAEDSRYVTFVSGCEEGAPSGGYRA
jgi:hypothetical protein